MTKALGSLGVVVVISGALIAGCGGGSSTSSSSATPAAVTSSSGAGSSGSATLPTSGSAVIARAVAACKADAARSTLSASLKAKILTLCEQALSGHEAGVQQQGAALCQQIVKSLPAA